MKLEDLDPLSKLIPVILFAGIVFFIKGIYSLFFMFLFLSSIMLMNEKRKSYAYFLLNSAPFLFSIWIVNAAFTFCGLEVLNLMTWKLTDKGIYAGNVVSLRILVLLVSSYLFISSTNPRDLLQMLVQRFKLNYNIAFASFIALRLLKESRKILSDFDQAYKARGLSLWNPNRILSMLSLLFFSTMRKLFSIAISAESRGFGAYNERIFRKKFYMKKSDYYFISLAIFILIFSIYIGYILGDLYLGLYSSVFC